MNPLVIPVNHYRHHHGAINLQVFCFQCKTTNHITHFTLNYQHKKRQILLWAWWIKCLKVASGMSEGGDGGRGRCLSNVRPTDEGLSSAHTSSANDSPTRPRSLSDLNNHLLVARAPNYFQNPMSLLENVLASEIKRTNLLLPVRWIITYNKNKNKTGPERPVTPVKASQWNL